MANEQEEWIPLRQAVAEVTAVYDEAMKASYSEARDEAVKAILRHLRFGFATANSMFWHLRTFTDEPINISNAGERSELPGYFWEYLSKHAQATADWVSGEFLFEADLDDGTPAFQGYAWAVKVRRNGLPYRDAQLGQPPNHASSKLNLLEERRGRFRKWDWEGAMCSIIAEANSLEGLPEGYGAQAKIAKMLANWFSVNQGGEPAPSEIGLRAAKIMTAIDSHRK